LARALIYAPLYYFLVFIAAWLISHISALVEANKAGIYAGAVPVCILLSILAEAAGAHKATGAPKKPTAPSP
jgi:hypothetical protein